MRLDAIHKKIGKSFKMPKVKRRKKLTPEKKQQLQVSLKKSNKKFRKIQSLINNWDVLRNKMKNYIERGYGTSITARLAYGVLLMMETGMRVGNEGSAEGYVCNNKYLPEFGKTIKTYGLTTINIDHVYRRNGTIFANFTGKKGVEQYLRTSEPTLVKYYTQIIGDRSKQAQFLGIDGEKSTTRLFKAFVKRSIGPKFTPKDIRTASVNLRFIDNLKEMEPEPQDKKGNVNRILNTLIEKTADQIGHTRGVCKSAYLSKTLVATIADRLYKPKEK